MGNRTKTGAYTELDHILEMFYHAGGGDRLLLRLLCRFIKIIYLMLQYSMLIYMLIKISANVFLGRYSVCAVAIARQ